MGANELSVTPPRRGSVDDYNTGNIFATQNKAKAGGAHFLTELFGRINILL